MSGTRTRGFRLKRKFVKVFRWVFKSRRRSNGGYHRLDSTSNYKDNYRSRTMTKLCSWGRSLKRGAKGLCFPGSPTTAQDYCRLMGRDDRFEEPKPVEVPKGHLAVYVGSKDDDPHRVLVPIIYFNHPLFGELLRRAEKEFGYNHPGGITIPCPISEFEGVQMRIAAGRRAAAAVGRMHQD